MLTDRQINIIKIVATIGLTITIIAVGIVMIKYGTILKQDPCSLCNCNRSIINNLIK